MNSPTYVQKINTTTKKQHGILQFLFSLSLTLFIIFVAVKLTLAFKPLYYFDVKYLNIEALSGFSKDEIIKNYDYVINFLLSPKVQEFNLPSIPYSKFGQIHFRDVKSLFTSIDILLVIAGLVSVLGITLNVKHKNYEFLKRTSYMLILLPTILLSAIMINFDKAFIIFHKIFFRNDYWQFDPDIDSIINILPEEFFFHAALMIVILIIISLIVLMLSYKRLTLKKQA
jgi:integral membrane protein (TIGR01906 family)